MRWKTTLAGESASRGQGLISGLGSEPLKNTKSKKKKEFKLEAGKTYWRRDRKEKVLVESHNGEFHPFFSRESGYYYHKDGRIFDDCKMGQDLVEEVKEVFELQYSSTQRMCAEDFQFPVSLCQLDLTDTTNPKDLVGIKKPPMSFIPPSLNVHLAMAFKNGADKYGAYNWRSTKVQMMIYLDAILRHTAAVIDGEDIAEDSQVDHLAHIAACCGVLLDAKETGNLIDNRPPKGKASEVIGRFTTC